MAKSSFTVKCDACSFSKEASSEDLANGVALQHVGSAHRDCDSAHMLGQHIHITANAAAAKDE